MKVGVHYSEAVGSNPAGDDYIRVAQHAEMLGYHSLWVGDHIVIPKTIHAAYPYTSDGSIGFPPNTPWPDPLTLLSAIGACTKKILLGTGITVVPYRNPIHVAKAVATADMMSNGRLVFGVGVGWFQEEYQALGVPFSERGTLTDEYLRIMKAMWTGGDTTFKGRYFSLPDMHVNPLPVQKPHPPIMIGGQGIPAFKRVVELGDGWLSGPIPPAELRSQTKLLSAMMTDAGRKISDIKLATVIYPEFARENKHELASLEETGFGEIVLYLRNIASADAACHELDILAKALIA
ncbi:MAG: LLM class F420-dependent oxidoreductase [Georgfuchsia sp.]